MAPQTRNRMLKAKSMMSRFQAITRTFQIILTDGEIIAVSVRMLNAPMVLYRVLIETASWDKIIGMWDITLKRKSDDGCKSPPHNYSM